MQIAHMINQLFELSSLFQPFLTGKMTVTHLWDCIVGEFRYRLNLRELNQLLRRKIQFRYD
ncbi:hypothetical protein GMMP15_660001 [Candidatus Magnetomoraceae bacterium gMMP-15]